LNFAVRSTSEEFLELVRRYIGHYRVDSNPGDEPPLEQLFSADCGEDRVLPGGQVAQGKRNLFFSYLRIYHGTLDDEMAGRLIGFTRDAAMLISNEFVRIRAGAVAVGSGAIVIPTLPEPHLPALVGHLVAAGAGYLGDESINLDPILHGAFSLRLPLLIDSRDMDLFPQLRRQPRRGKPFEPRDESVRAASPRRPVAPDELGSGYADPAPTRWLVFPVFQPGGETRLEPFGGAEAVFLATQSVLNLHAWEDRALVLLRELLESVPVSRLVIGSVQEAARLVMEAAPSMVEGVIT
jgi:hypothetical protein